MTDRTAIEALIAKVEAGQIDPDKSIPEFSCICDVIGRMDLPLVLDAYKAYTGSLDAAKALHDAALPDISQYSIETDPTCLRVQVAAWPNGLSGGQEITGEGWHEANPARAWLLAILKALSQAQEGA